MLVGMVREVIREGDRLCVPKKDGLFQIVEVGGRKNDCRIVVFSTMTPYQSPFHISQFLVISQGVLRYQAQIFIAWD